MFTNPLHTISRNLYPKWGVGRRTAIRERGIRARAPLRATKEDPERVRVARRAAPRELDRRVLVPCCLGVGREDRDGSFPR